MDVSLTLWIVTIAGLLALIAVDFLIGRTPHEVSLREAGTWTVVWLALAGLFGLGVGLFAGAAPAGEFFAGFVTEKALSVDNLFVFVLILAKFQVPALYQQRVLLVGVLLALVLRAGFIAAGAAVISTFVWTFYLFGAFLLWTAWKMVRQAREGETEEYRDNAVLRWIAKVVPTTREYHGTRLSVRDGNGTRRLMTPMLIVMVAVGTTDVLFALDSIPAIFGITQEPYLVLTANAFALMGLRQLYFLLGGLLRKLVYLSHGLSVILAFIGVKLVIEALHGTGVDAVGPVSVPEVPISVSLGFIVVTLLVTTVLSLRASRRGDAASAR